ncbi:hypothetical protein GQR58_016180 [Nymphon striatum]|nr:hypothetical protein GQR58_016180 [Nymphon striatum]
MKEDKKPLEVKPQFSLAPHEAIISTEVTSEINPHEMQTMKPKSDTGRVEFVTQETFSVQEIQIGEGESNLVLDQQKKSYLAEQSIIPSESMMVTKVESEIMPEDYVPEVQQPVAEAQTVIPEEKSITVSEVVSEVQTEELNLDKAPDDQEANETTIITEVQPEGREKEFDAKFMPNEHHAKPSISATEPLQITEVIPESNTADFTTHVEEDSAILQFVPQKPLTVMEITHHDREDEFFETPMPNEKQIKPMIMTEESISVLEIQTATKESALEIPETCSTKNATASFAPKEHLIITETEANSEHEDILSHVHPTEVSATPEIMPYFVCYEKEEHLKEDFQPEHRVAQTEITPLKTVNVLEVHTDSKESELSPVAQPQAQLANKIMPQDKHLTVSEVQSTMNTEYFSPEQSVEQTAHLTLIEQEPISVSEIITDCRETKMGPETIPVPTKAKPIIIEKHLDEDVHPESHTAEAILPQAESLAISEVTSEMHPNYDEI